MNQESTLHHLATRSSDAKRQQEIDSVEYRPGFARDRDRILYSRCFRRLAHKTQVYPLSEGMEHARMRLTHTLEVSQVARAIARALGMNEDLVEAIALGHDVGHAPFGHAGEVQLHKFLQNEHQPPRHMLQRVPDCSAHIPKMDFRHNFQSVRTLCTLEKYELSNDVGLGLSEQCLEGVLKHTRVAPRGTGQKPYSYPDVNGLFAKFLEQKEHGTIESQIVAIADELTQVAHDLSDAVLYKLINAPSLKEQPRIKDIMGATAKGERLARLLESPATAPQTVASHLASMLISYFVDESIRTARAQLRDDAIQNPRMIALWHKHVPEPADSFIDLREYKDNLVINCHPVNRMDNKGSYIIRQLLDAYVSDPRQLPDAAFVRYGTAIRGGNDSVAKLLTENSRHLPIDLRLGESDCAEIARVIDSEPGGLRKRLSAVILSKLPYYLLFDENWRRTIADQIALMTDSNAEKEMRALYGVG